MLTDKEHLSMYPDNIFLMLTEHDFSKNVDKEEKNFIILTESEQF